MAKYAMDLKNFYWNIMITPKCEELVSMLETYSDLRADYLALWRRDYISPARIEAYEKMLRVERDMVDFIEKNIDLEHYGLERYNKDIFAKHGLVLVLTQMYEADI